MSDKPKKPNFKSIKDTLNNTIGSPLLARKDGKMFYFAWWNINGTEIILN